MYGKFFASTFTGSMFGAGPAVFAVWGYVIANTVDSRVELNPKLLASILGTTEAAVTQAIKELCEPDPLSRNPTDEGRRLQREGQFQYRVTSHAIYRALQNTDGLREYNRQKQREFRKKRAAVKLNVIDSQEMSRHTEANTEADTNTEANTKTDRGSSTVLANTQQQAGVDLSSADADFETFRAIYPPSRRVGGKQARSAFKTAMKGKAAGHLPRMITAVEQHKRSAQWQDPKLIPLMTTWLNQERWNQVLPEPNYLTAVSSQGQSNAAAMSRAATRIQERAK